MRKRLNRIGSNKIFYKWPISPMNQGENFDLNAFPLDQDVPGSLDSTLIGDGQRADCIWTKDQFLDLCGHMLNGNPLTDFLMVYRDADGAPKFAKAKKAQADRRVAWAWDTIRGVGKSKVGVGFYPTNPEQKTRWGAMDFDARNRDGVEARRLALAAFAALRRQTHLYIVLGTSGSEGWHLFAFAENFYPIADWTLLLKRTAGAIGAEIKSGFCEIFPNEAHGSSWPYPIRAPGTWNPKTNQEGLIFFSSVGPLLKRRAEERGKREKSPFIYRSTNGLEEDQLNDREGSSFYSGGRANWLQQFAIIQPGARHTQLRALVHHIFRQVGHRVARRNAETQFKGARPPPNATLAEDLDEFEELWTWTEKQWLEDLSVTDREIFMALNSEAQRDLFRVLRNFAQNAESKRAPDFPFPIEHVARRIGVSLQYVSKLRQRFIQAGIVAQTTPPVINRSAAKFRWCLDV